MDTKRIKVINELLSSDSGIEFETPETRKRKDGLIKTIVPYFPIRDKVVVRNVFEESILVTRDEAKIRQSNPKSVTVVAIGDEVQGLELEDDVHVSFNATIEPIKFKNNKKGIKKMIELLNDTEVKFNPMELEQKKVVMIEYYCVPMFAINGVITE